MGVCILILSQRGIMTRYVALLRGINVGGNNIISMEDLKKSFEHRGFEKVRTYINSGNILFSSNLNSAEARTNCEKLIAEDFSLDIPVCVISDTDLIEALSHAPTWWNTGTDIRHNAFFVIPPKTAQEICAYVGEVKGDYEKVAVSGEVIFWSARLADFSKTRWSKLLSGDKSMYRSITVRNANTTLKLAELLQAED